MLGTTNVPKCFRVARPLGWKERECETSITTTYTFNVLELGCTGLENIT